MRQKTALIIRHVPYEGVAGFRAPFIYCVHGRRLRASLYPPRTVLYRARAGRYVDEGHGHRLVIAGEVASLENAILHDDRKPLSHWLNAQDRYMRLEVANIAGKPWDELSMADRVRQFPLIAPFAVFANCYLLNGGFLDGRAGLYYALQRMLAEALLGLRMIEKSLP